MGFYSGVFYSIALNNGYLNGVSTTTADGRFKYIHGVGESAYQYLTVLTFINNYDKSEDYLKEIISSLEKIINNNYKNEDVVKVGRFINSHSLARLVLNFFPKEVNEINNIISNMSVDELNCFINNFKMKSNNNEKVDVLIAYLNYCLDEKKNYEQFMRFESTADERTRSRADLDVIMRQNDTAGLDAIERASKIRM